jgi:putative protease
VEYLPELLAAGVGSLKIEGRMKSRYYVAAVTRVYRAALDAWLKDPDTWRFDPLWREELDKVSHRPYGTGFLFGGDDPQIHRRDSSYVRLYDFVGVVQSVAVGGKGVVQGRNRFFPGDSLELIGPGMRGTGFHAGELLSENGEPLAAGQPNARIVMDLPDGTQPGDLLRRERVG